MKYDNIIINKENNNFEVKIIDFNVSRSRQNVEYDGECKKNMIMYSIAGTPQFSAPELLDCVTCYTEQVDIWSIGCIMYFMSLGKLAYNGGK